MIPDPGRSHMLQSNQAHVPQLLCLYSRAQEPQLPSPQVATTAARVPQSSHSTREKPPQGEARVPQSSHSAREKPPPGEACTSQPDSEPSLTATREKPQTAKTKENILKDAVCVCIHKHTHTHIHTYTQWNYYSLKKQEILPVMTTWMDLEDFMLDERRQKKRKTR